MKLIRLFLILSAFLISTDVFAAQVLKVKGKAILVNNEGDFLEKGSLYYLVTNSNKKVGIIKIFKSKQGKTLAKLLKGKAAPKLMLVKRPSKSKKSTTAKKKSSAPKLKSISRRRTKKSYKKKDGFRSAGLGFNLGYNSNSSEVSFLDTSGNLARVDSYTGTTISYELFYDLQILEKLQSRVTLGMHNFMAEDTENTQCIDSNGQAGAQCIVDLSYINIDVWGRYFLTQSWHNIWVGAGIGLLLSPSENSTTALNPDDIGMTTLVQAGGGADISLSDKFYMPLSVEYGFYPPSDTVDMSSISFYFGLGYKL